MTLPPRQCHKVSIVTFCHVLCSFCHYLAYVIFIVFHVFHLFRVVTSLPLLCFSHTGKHLWTLLFLTGISHIPWLDTLLCSFLYQMVTNFGSRVWEGQVRTISQITCFLLMLPPLSPGLNVFTNSEVRKALIQSNDMPINHLHNNLYVASVAAYIISLLSR